MFQRIRIGFLSSQPTSAPSSIDSTFLHALQTTYPASICQEVPRGLIQRRPSRTSMVSAKSLVLSLSSIRPWALIISTELWYSAVIRSSSLYGDESAPDLSRKVADWTRFCLWSKYDLFTKRLHVVTLGCPPAMREDFQSIFQGENGLQLQRHPMILHAHFARAAMLQTHDFLCKFSEPLYENASFTCLTLA